MVLFGDGSQSRDFTYVDDIARGTIAALPPVGFEVINLGSDSPSALLEVIGWIKRLTGKRAVIDQRDFVRTDIPATWADIGKSYRLFHWKPVVTLEEGLRRMVQWYREQGDWVQQLTLGEE